MIDDAKYCLWGLLIFLFVVLATDAVMAMTSDQTEDLIRKMAEHKATFIVKYEAKWCGYCHKLTPILKEVADKEGFYVLTVDIDKCYKPVDLYGVPALDVYVEGELKGRYYGYKSKEDLTKLLKKLKM